MLRVIRHRHVVNCVEAAEARGIPLERELKTLVLRTGYTLVAVHLCAHQRLRIRSVKKILRRDNFSFVEPAVLAGYGLRPGTINPWNTGFCPYHLVCLDALRNEVMATNNSNLCEGLFFETHHLLGLPNSIMGRFGHEQD